MKSIMLFILFAFTVASCASYQSNIRHIRKNPAEIIEFKSYLEKNYKINRIDKYQMVWARDQDDTIIKNFCLNNNIGSITILPQTENTHYFNKYGKIVELNFNNIYFIEDNESVIFDYTDKGLEFYDADAAKYKIADRIFIFR